MSGQTKRIHRFSKDFSEEVEDLLKTRQPTDQRVEMRWRVVIPGWRNKVEFELVPLPETAFQSKEAFTNTVEAIEKDKGLMPNQRELVFIHQMQ